INACAFNNKTAVGRIGDQHMAGSECADELMKLTARRACEVYGAEHANIQPYSGATANYSIYSSCLNIGDTVLSLNPNHGGHGTHGSSGNMVSKMYRFEFYSVNEKTQLIDYDELERLAKKLRPKLIIAGGSTYSQYIDFRRMADIAHSVGAYLHADMAHYTGLIAAGIIPSPVPYADFVTGSTTKTICGPRSGFILCKKAHADMVDKGVYPSVVASMHLQTMAGMAHAFYYAGTPEFRHIMEKTVENAQALCECLQERGFNILTGGTKCHLMIVDMRNRGISAKEFVNVLDGIGISTNPVPIPYDDSPVRNGLRIGTTVCSQRGMGPEQMEIIADIIDRAARSPKDKAVLLECAGRVRELTAQFPLYGYYDSLSAAACAGTDTGL
ncbi:MAG: serine hydroxymethyltransferase, partial [Clostridia bacterium]|nr:serine hydroxymethyltransferase [Clostridia bacterium]